MVDPRRSPLDGLAEELAQVAVRTGGRLRVVERTYASQLNVRAPAAVVAQASAALGIALPTTPNTVARSGDAIALWLGPDEWLVLDGRADVAGGDGWGLVDVSAQRAAIVLSGPESAGLLAFGCALDLERAGAGWCVQTMLARAQVVLFDGPPDEIIVLVRASFAPYVAAWLLDAVPAI